VGAEANRVVCILAGQAANVAISLEALKCPMWSEAPCAFQSRHHCARDRTLLGGRGVPASWTAYRDKGLASLFLEVVQGGADPLGYPGGLIQEAIDWTVAQKKVADQYQLELFAYEAGQHFVNPNTAVLTDLYIAANRDERMNNSYAMYLKKWKEAGGHLLIHLPMSASRASGDPGVRSKTLLTIIPQV